MASGYALFCLVFGLFFESPCLARENAGNGLPRIVMLEVPGVTPHDLDLYTAIIAQTSAVPLVFDRVDVPSDVGFATDPLASAAKLARENDASMVFWIEDRQTCRLFFYIPNQVTERINSRTLDLHMNSSWSRFQTVAIATASMIEGLLTRNQIKSISLQGKPRVSAVVKPHETEVPVSKRKWSELFGAYAGSLFAANQFTNGAFLGVGIRPNDHVVIAAAFTPNAPVRLETAEYRLEIISRSIEVSTAVRVQRQFMEIRMGLAWSFDPRSYSTTFKTENIDASSDGVKGVHTLIPFVCAVWKFNDRFGIMTRVGAGVSLNDTVYKIHRIDGESEALVPFHIKLSYQLGLFIQI